MLVLFLCLTHFAYAGKVIVFYDKPILKDQTIVVETYYNDPPAFDGYHTEVYSTRHPSLLFLSHTVQNDPSIIHTQAQLWISNRILQELNQRIHETMLPHLELYDIDEEENGDACQYSN